MIIFLKQLEHIGCGSLVSQCQSTCIAECESIELIRQSACRGLCIDHCINYSSELISPEQTRCLLGCKYMQHDETTVCRPLCKIDSVYNLDEQIARIQRADPEPGEGGDKGEKIDVSNVCTGYGRELCYKICRLHNLELIETCLCACCKCKF